jgi:hypothetical protein
MAERTEMDVAFDLGRQSCRRDSFTDFSTHIVACWRMVSVARLEPQSRMFPITVDWQLAFLRPESARGLDYWQSLCAGRPMPHRRELNPRAMKGFLNYVNLVDVATDADGTVDYVLSLQSAHARDVFGPMAGRLDQFLPVPVRQRWRDCFDLPRLSGRPARVSTRVSTVGKDWLACEALFAPLGDGEVNSVLWVFISWLDESLDRTPRRS